MDFEELYKTYFHDVYLFILAMSKSSDIAEEVTQETFLKALKSFNKFKGNCSVKTWLCQIGKNTYLSHLKKQKYLTGQKHDTDGMDNLSGTHVQESTEALCLRKNEALSLYKILHYLEEPYKEVFTLRVLGDLSYREIAEIFGQKEGWARVTYHRAKLKIQEFIKEV